MPQPASAGRRKKATPGTVQFDKLAAEIPEKQENIKAQVQFRHDLLESQKRVNYHNEFDRSQGVKKLSGLSADTKSRMQELQRKAIQSLNGSPSHRSYSTKFQ